MTIEQLEAATIVVIVKFHVSFFFFFFFFSSPVGGVKLSRATEQRACEAIDHNNIVATHLSRFRALALAPWFAQ